MRRLLWLAGLLPLMLLVWEVGTGQTGADPLREIEHRLGRTALYLLGASLAVTPLRRVGVNWLRYRRTLGLLCAVYAGLHVAAWAALDMGMDWGAMARDVVRRPYLGLGATAAAVIAVLAATSSDAAIRRLGPRRWRLIHRAVYAVPILAMAHWMLALKLIGPWPQAVAAGFALLLGFRLVPRRRKVVMKT